MSAKWTLVGYDTFDGEYYSLPGSYDSKPEAEAAAKKRLLELEVSQPSANSGGQFSGGIQDRVFVKSPSGEMIRC